MKIINTFIEGINAAMKGMMSVAGFGILAILLPFMMLKMKGTEGREIVRSIPKLKATQASLAETSLLREIPKETIVQRDLAIDPNSFSFGNSIEQDRRPIINRSQDPNEAR